MENVRCNQTQMPKRKLNEKARIFKNARQKHTCIQSEIAQHSHMAGRKQKLIVTVAVTWKRRSRPACGLKTCTAWCCCDGSFKMINNKKLKLQKRNSSEWRTHGLAYIRTHFGGKGMQRNPLEKQREKQDKAKFEFSYKCFFSHVLLLDMLQWLWNAQ